MKLLRIVLLILVMMSASIEMTFAKSRTLTQKELQEYKPLKANEGRKLMPLSKAKLSDVHLVKAVKYFDIKSYEINYDDLIYTGGWSFDMAAYSRLSKYEKQKIRSVKPVKSKEPFGATYFLDSPMREIYNLHYIDMHSNVHTFASRKKLLDFLGEIDTPTELHMALLNREGEIRFKRLGNIYILRHKSVSFEDYDNDAYDCSVSIYHEIMDMKGTILLSKEISYKEYRGKKCEKL
ncbi:MAG: hypothetical protein FAF03_01750 [Epsilonproteobacteria bacterium]|nr:hypothetical protein [Campylobacterota bacterium]